MTDEKNQTSAILSRRSNSCGSSVGLRAITLAITLAVDGSSLRDGSGKRRRDDFGVDIGNSEALERVEDGPWRMEIVVHCEK